MLLISLCTGLGSAGAVARPPMIEGSAYARNLIANRDAIGYFNPRNTFGEFLVGTGNQFAHAAPVAAADKPGDAYNLISSDAS
jgi:chromosomal replication initiator protein